MISVVTDSGKEYTYSDLYADSRSLSQVCVSRSLAFCLCRNSYASLVGYVGFLNGKVPTVLLDADKDAEMLATLIRLYAPRYVWTPSERVGDLPEGKVVYAFEEYNLLKYDTVDATDVLIYPDLAVCLTTSGSTGSPKLVRLSYENLKANAESIATYLDITSNERAITSLPMYYSYGLSVINSHLLRGATLLMTEGTVMQKQFWTMMKEQRATSMAGVPYTYEMLKRLRFFRMDLPDLNTMTQAGGKLHPDLAKEYIEFAKEKSKRFIVMYGQTEATARMSYLPWDNAQEKFASIGVAIPGGRLSVRDDHNQTITEPGVDGELIYEGPNVSMGYAECRADLAKGDENHGVLHTGDVAHFDEDGFFYITGRMKRFVKIWGNRCNLDATEQLAKNITPRCACVGVDDKITIFVAEEGLEEQIKSHLSAKMGLHSSAFAVRYIPEIPRKVTGKIDYPALQKMIEL